MPADGRTFDDAPATRQAVPLMLGLMGPSGSGKTCSALRMATGIASVTGGEIFVIDTESRRSLHYSDRFKFRHVHFVAPFGPLDYLAAIEHCIRRGASVVIVDSMSHEHEGPGGVLEQHEREVERLSGGDERKAERVKMLAWAKPKAARRRLINTLTQVHVNAIFCFRAKEKLKIQRGQEPKPLGWMPIAGEEFLYEMTANALLHPGAGGVPSWTVSDDEPGSREMIKLPQYLRSAFAAGGPLSEETGAALARWASGEVSEAKRLAAAIIAAETTEALRAVWGQIDAAKAARSITQAEAVALKTAVNDRKAAIEQAADAPPATPRGAPPPEPGSAG